MTGHSIGPACPGCTFTHGGECPPPALVAQARDYVARTEFTFAKTMPQNPHWYVVRRGDPGHEALFVLIRDHHYLRRWHGRAYRSIDLDGFSYWIMEDGTVINRKPVERAGWDDEHPTLF